MKKLEASIIKIHQRIDLEPFFNLILELASERRKSPREESKQERKGRKRKAKDGK